MFRRMLQKLGINVDVAQNGEELIEILTKDPNKYHLILMDIEMPIMGLRNLKTIQHLKVFKKTNSFFYVVLCLSSPDGPTATREIRQRNLHTPIVALSAYAFPEHFERWIGVGMQDFLSKPVTFEELQKIVLKYCGKTQNSLEPSESQK